MKSIFNLFETTGRLIRRFRFFLSLTIVFIILGAVFFYTTTLNKSLTIVKSSISSRLWHLIKHIDNKDTGTDISTIFTLSTNGILKSTDRDLKNMDIHQSALFKKTRKTPIGQFRIFYYPDISSGIIKLHIVKRYPDELRIGVLARGRLFKTFQPGFRMIINNRHKICIYSSDSRMIGSKSGSFPLSFFEGKFFLASSSQMPGLSGGSISILMDITLEIIILLLFITGFSLAMLKFRSLNRTLLKSVPAIRSEFMELGDVIGSFSTIPLAEPDIVQRSSGILKQASFIKNDMESRKFLYEENLSIVKLLIKLTRIMIEISEMTKKDSQALKKAVEEREFLLKEIHHRVKNNMQIITSLLHMQLYKTDGETSKNILEESINRVYSMSLVHEILYQHEDLSAVDMENLCRTLCKHLQRIYSNDETEIDTKIIGNPPPLPLPQAIPCALILNELLTNAFKHAFTKVHTGQISITFNEEKNRESDSEIYLKIEDNGKGLPPNFQTAKDSNLGLKLVQTLVGQLNGELNWSSGQGSVFEIRFPEYTPRASDRGK